VFANTNFFGLSRVFIKVGKAQFKKKMSPGVSRERVEPKANSGIYFLAAR